jgi:hydrogenase maturation protease
MSRVDGPLLVLGVGNILMRDEGVGVRVVERLRVSPELLPADVRIVDGGTLGLDLLPLIEEARGLILVDAIDVQAAPGTLVVLRGHDVTGAFGGHVSPLQVGVGDLVAIGELTAVLPEAITLVGIQLAEIDVGLELSEAVEAAVPGAVIAVRDELRAMAAATDAFGAGAV